MARPPALTVNTAVEASETICPGIRPGPPPGRPRRARIRAASWICSSVSFAVRNGWSGMTDPTGRQGLLARVAEDDRAVAVEGEGRRLAPRSRPAARTRRPRRSAGSRRSARSGARWRRPWPGSRSGRRSAGSMARRRPPAGRCSRPHSSTRPGPGRGRPEPRGARSSTWRPDVDVARIGSTRRVTLRKGSKGLDGARIFTAMSSGLPSPGRPGAHPSFRHASADPLPTRCRGPRASWRPSRGRVWRGCTRTEPDLSRLRRGVQLLGRRAGLLCQQGPDQRPPALPVVPSGRQARPLERGPARVPCRDLRGLRGSGRRAVRATQRSTGLLQLLLRQGPGRHAHRGAGDRLAMARIS